MFEFYFRLYSFVYIIACLQILILEKNIKRWDTFTRIVSTVNALQCSMMTLSVLFDNLSSVSGANLFDWPNYYPLSNIFYVPTEWSINMLYSFSAYLLVDGIFQVGLLDSLSVSSFLMLLHHFLGCLGIYMLANIKILFYIGFYFAMTEISTPLLNLSWLTRSKISYVLFYLAFFFTRIFSIPFILNYLYDNSIYIVYLDSVYYYMAYYASYTVITINCLWFAFLNLKLIDIIFS